MNPYKKTLRTWGPVAAGLLLLLLATSPSTFGQNARPLQVVSHEVDGNVVSVTVSNPNAEATSGTVAVRAVVNDRVVSGFVPVSVMGHGAQTTQIGFPGSVQGVITLGTNESSDPFG